MDATAQYRKQAETHPHDDNIKAFLAPIYFGKEPQKVALHQNNSPAFSFASFLLPPLLLTVHNKGEGAAN